jgi:hypothetical protein
MEIEKGKGKDTLRELPPGRLRETWQVEEGGVMRQVTQIISANINVGWGSSR